MFIGFSWCPRTLHVSTPVGVILINNRSRFLVIIFMIVINAYLLNMPM